jgi:hypothetical protein
LAQCASDVVARSKRRSNLLFYCGMDCFAEPAIGLAEGETPVAGNDVFEFHV